MSKNWKTIPPAVLLMLVAGTARAELVGLWNFNNNLDNVIGGSSMSENGFAASYSAVTIGGDSANALSFPAFDPTQSLVMPNDAGANGGGSNTNEWSIVMDVNFPVIGGWTSFWQTNPNIADDDGEFFIKNIAEGIGISGQYHGTFSENEWHRVVATIRPNGAEYAVDKYIDGVFVGTSSSGTPLDGRHSVPDALQLFADNGNETTAGLVSSIAYYDNVLSANEVQALGGVSAAGIPVPEPGSLVLMVMGLAGMLCWRRFRTA